MLHENSSPWQTSDWQNALSDLITCPEVLATRLEIPPLTRVETSFPLRIPASLLARIQKNNPNDPVLNQFLLRPEEMEIHAGFSKHPLKEQNYNPAPGLLHKFKGRVLLTVTQSCAVHCRYCFRRHFDYESNRLSKSVFEESLQYIRNDNSLHEVILSGGDPLNLNDKHLAWILSELASIAHVKIIRFHTRAAVIIPQRITSEFLALLDTERFKFVFIIHCNHAQEIDQSVQQSLQILRKKGMVLNQAVLLKDINDSFNTQFELCHRLLACDVMPYYLHLLDPVEGAAHFQVDVAKARAIHAELKANLPGYAVPRLVREVPGEPNKVDV